MAGGSLADHIWKDIAHHTRYNSWVLSKLYKEIQQREAEKVPGDWRPVYTTVHNSQSTQIIGKTHRRSSLSISNLGPSVVLVSNRAFDGPASVLAYNAGAFEATLDVLPLNVNQTITIPSSGAVYAYSVSFVGTTPPYTNEQAVVQLVETVFDSWQSDMAPQAWLPGQMGLMERGMDVDHDGQPESVDRAAVSGVTLT